MSSKTYTVTNTFHNSTARVRGKADAEGFVCVSGSVYRRVCRELCGIKGCQCDGHQNYMEPAGSNPDTCGWRIKVA